MKILIITFPFFIEIQAEKESTNHHCVDFLVLLIEHKLSTRPKPFEDLLKLKLQNESISADLVKDAFKLYGFVLKNYFDELRAVAYSLLLSKVSKLQFIFPPFKFY